MDSFAPEQSELEGLSWEVEWGDQGTTGTLGPHYKFGHSNIHN